MYATTYPIPNSSAMLSDGNTKTSPAENYLHHLSGQEKDPDIIMLDHSYARPWNAHPDSNHAKPARMLFMKGLSRHPHVSTSSGPDLEIDVDTVESKPVPPYDNIKTRSIMNECERHVNINHIYSTGEEKEDHIKRTGWTIPQNRLFNKVMKVLQTDRLARLTFEGTINEPVKRRISVDKTARRIRQIFASFGWDMKLLHWLHQSLMDSLSSSLLAAYFDVLQTLKYKVPTLIDKMLSQHTHATRSGFTCCGSSEALNQLIKRQWDPLLPLLNHHKSKKLPGAPLIVMTPSGPNQLTINQSRRMKFWNGHLAALGKVVNVSFHAVNGGSGVSVNQCLEHIIGAVRTKVLELKSHFPNRPIILLGWTIGALIACHVALAESVTAVVCLGFPLTGISGSRGDLDDPLLDSKVPTLFIIGQNASMCSMDDIEDFRERMRAETGLVVVGGADDVLRISRIKKKLDSITQVMVDRCLVDEVTDFLAGVLTRPPSPSTFHIPTKKSYGTSSVGDEVKRRKRKPKEIESPESSPPTKRKPRQSSSRQSHPSVTSKASSSSSSSETSSTGSCASEKRVTSEVTKKTPGRKIGRPPTSMLKKRQITKNVAASSEKIIPSLAARKSEENQTFARNASKMEATKPALSSIASPTSRGLSLCIGSLSSLGKFNQSKVLAIANQQKNDPVDVEKAFGRDSSFLPRPLTPSEPDAVMPSGSPKSPLQDPSSPIKLESEIPADISLGEKLVSSAPLSIITSTISRQSTPKPKYISVPATSLSGILGTVSSPKISYIKSSGNNFPSPGAFVSEVKSSNESPKKAKVPLKTIEPVIEPDKEQVEAIQKLQYHDFPLTTACLTRSATSGTPVITQAKILTSGGLNLKQLQSLSQTQLVSKSLLSTPSTSQTTSVATPSSLKSPTLLLSPSLEPTTFLISSSGKASPAKSIQVQGMILKGSSMMPTKIQVPLLSKFVSPVKAGATKETTSAEYLNQQVDQPSCNLSLLSDVAGMKEPIREILKRTTEAVGSSHATLVKLAPSEKGQNIIDASSPKPLLDSTEALQLTQLKRLQICENFPTHIKMPSPPLRFETPEELAEKQMAIQVLSSSFSDEGESPAQTSYSKEPGYSICYTNPDGSVISRTVTGQGYSVVLPTSAASGALGLRSSTAQPRSSGRGRGAHAFPSVKSKIQTSKFYEF